jgi:hypothetical protein
MTIGRYPAMPASVARATAKEMRAAADLGRDPLAEHRKARRAAALATASMRVPKGPAAHYLYRLSNDFGELLYVGETKNVGLRLKEHSHKSPWYHEFAILTVERFASKAEAKIAEGIAIRDENPRYNVSAGFRSPALIRPEEPSRSAPCCSAIR